jgi:putative inorganic carbon (hco3(-)) transporter
MGALVSLLYIAVSILSPTDAFPSLAPYRINLILSFAALFLSLPALLGRSTSLLFSRETALMVCLFITIPVSRLAHLWFGGALSSIGLFLSTAIVFLLVAANFSSVKSLRLLAMVLLVTTLGVSCKGIYAYTTRNYTSPYIYISGDPDEENPDAVERAGHPARLRGLGFLQDPNDFAQQILIVLSLTPLLWKKGALFRNCWLLIAIPILLYAMVLTGSRGSMLGLAAMTAFLLRNKIGRTKSMIAATVLLVVSIGAGFTSSRGAGIEDGGGRYITWGTAINHIKERPVFGLGFLDYEDAEPLTAHNSFLLCFAELGLVGYTFWMASLVLGLRDMRLVSANTQTGDELRSASEAIRAALVVFVVTGWFLSRTYVLTLFLLLGAAKAVTDMYQGREKKVFAIDIMRLLAFSGALEIGSVMLAYILIRVRGIL